MVPAVCRISWMNQGPRTEKTSWTERVRLRGDPLRCQRSLRILQLRVELAKEYTDRPGKWNRGAQRDPNTHMENGTFQKRHRDPQENSEPFSIVRWDNGFPHEKTRNYILTFTSLSTIQSKLIEDLHIKGKNLNFLEKNCRLSQEQRKMFIELTNQILYNKSLFKKPSFSFIWNGYLITY